MEKKIGAESTTDSFTDTTDRSSSGARKTRTNTPAERAHTRQARKSKGRMSGWMGLEGEEEEEEREARQGTAGQY